MLPLGKLIAQVDARCGRVLVLDSLRLLCVLGVSAVNVFERCSPQRRRVRGAFAEKILSAL